MFSLKRNKAIRLKHNMPIFKMYDYVCIRTSDRSVLPEDTSSRILENVINTYTTTKKGIIKVVVQIHCLDSTLTLLRARILQCCIYSTGFEQVIRKHLVLSINLLYEITKVINCTSCRCILHHKRQLKTFNI